MTRKLLLTTVALAGLMPFASAQAQDWNGFYAGGSLGYNFQPGDKGETILFDKNLDGNFSDTITTAAGANAFSPGFCGGRANTALPADGCKTEKDDLEWSGRLGYDWQFDNIVIGGVAELSKHNINDSVSAFSTTPARYTMTRELNWSLAARVRAGFATDMSLIYLTGGWVHGDVDHTFSTSNAVNTFTLSGGDSQNGYQYGAGFDWKLGDGNWAVGAEYLYTKLDDDDFRVRAGGPAPATNPFILTNASGTDFARSGDKFSFSTVKVTLTYRFGS